MIDRAGLADFLRRRREQLRPDEVGLPPSARRRTPGLRREEVAQLAGMSTDYYARLEQSRGANPSAPIVAGLARALRCDLDQRDHLYRLAGLAPPLRRAGGHLEPGLLGLVDRLTDIPVCVCTDIEQVLWQNPLADALLGRPAGTGLERSLTWRWFTAPETRRIFPEADWDAHSSAHVADLRATFARRRGDRDVTDLVEALLARSPEFRELWDLHEVTVRRLPRKRVLHPEVGAVDLSCEVLLTPDADVRVRAFLPLPGTDASEKLALLRVIGTQSFAP